MKGLKIGDLAFPTCHRAGEQASAGRESAQTTKQEPVAGMGTRGVLKWQGQGDVGGALPLCATTRVSSAVALKWEKVRLNEDKLVSLLQDAS